MTKAGRGVKKLGATTIKQVAQHAGVSTATVSRALADAKGVGDQLRRRVRHVAKRLGYEPSRVARSLRVGTRLTVGVVIPDIQNPFFTSIVRGIEDVLHGAGYTLLLANSNEVPLREQRMLSTLRSEGVAGIVFVPINAAKTGYRQLLTMRTPVVAVDRLPAGLRTDLVTVANAEGARVATKHLIALHHRDIALLGGPPQHSTAYERQLGYEQALTDAGIPIRADFIVEGDFREAGGYAGMKALLARPHVPTAVFVANNLMTLGALRAIHESGLRIPTDLALVSFDDIPWAASLNPPLTAVAQPAYEIGGTAAGLLLHRIADPERPVRHVVLETRLIVRASCGAIAQSSAVNGGAEASRPN
jgi:LacI family transcriptional regulator